MGMIIKGVKMSVQTAVKELTGLKKRRQTLQEQKAKNNIDQALAANDQEIELQEALVYDLARAQALKELDQLRKKEVKLVADYVAYVAGLEKIQDAADELRFEFNRVAGPYRKGDDVFLAGGSMDTLQTIGTICFRYREESQNFDKLYKKRTSGFIGYGR